MRLPRELRERLRAAARQAGISESELAREAIDDYLAKGARTSPHGNVPPEMPIVYVAVEGGSGRAGEDQGGKWRTWASGSWQAVAR